MGYMRDRDGNRLDGISVRGRTYPHALFRGLPVIAGRPNGQTFNGTNLSDGTNTSANFRYSHPVFVTASEMRLVYGNIYGAYSGGPNTIMVKASVEFPLVSSASNTGQVGAKVKVYFNGARTATIESGGFVVSDPIPIEALAGNVLYSRTYVSVATAGQKWPIDLYTESALWEGSTLGAPATDLSDAASNIGNNSFTGYGPIAIIGVPAKWTPVVALIGDSILYGSGDSYPNGLGFAVRALTAAKVPYLQVSRPGERIYDVSGSSGTSWEQGYAPRMIQVSNCTHAIEEYVHNDYAISGYSLAQIQANKILLWKVLQKRGIPVWLTTAIPQTNSTDGWITTTNQTGLSYDTTRLGYNAWVRDGAPLNSADLSAAAVGSTTGAIRAGNAAHPVAGYFETADTVETARDSGLWKTPIRVLTDAAMSASSANLTSTTGAFTSADVGRQVSVVGAGSSGGVLSSSIGLVNSSTSVTLLNGAATTVSGAKAGIGVQTVDGTHPSQDGHSQMAAVIDTTKFV